MASACNIRCCLNERDFTTDWLLITISGSDVALFFFFFFSNPYAIHEGEALLSWDVIVDHLYL